MKIGYSKIFLKKLKKLPQNIQQRAFKQEKLFRKNTTHPSLSHHKLQGRLEQYNSISIDYHYRIILKYETPTQVIFIDIGTHSIYQ